MFIIKQITQLQIDALVKDGIIRNTNKGYVSYDGTPTGFYATKNKKYIEDKYVDIAENL